MTTCASCSRSLPDGAITCPACGASVDEESTPTRYQSAPPLARDTAGAEPQPRGERLRERNTTTPVSGARGEGRFVTGAVLAGRYRIVSLVGKGGMGEVYKADDLKLNQSVALKFLPAAIALDGGMLARFHNEVRIARQVSHPAVCRVYDIGEVEDLHFISMEFIDGEDLSTLLRRIGRLPGDKAVEVARQICAGLAAAHESGVLHRDLKPANIMIDGRGKARITDFGVAVLSEDLRGDEVMAGTPAYMAPEQLTGREVTRRSDIYSLGLVLYELFTGKRVFEAGDIRELIQLHEKSAPAIPTSYVKEIDPLVERVIMRCLERDPRQRPSSAAQVAAALPGGDPLAAALAAGETPSPEVVAAALKQGVLRPSVAAACLAGFLVLLALLVLFSGRVHLDRWAPLQKSPEVLAERAGNFIARLGYTSAAAGKAYGFDLDTDYLEYAREDSSPNRWQRIIAGQPLTYFFWYRQSPRRLDPANSTKVTMTDPPRQVSGMTSVILDPRGRLVEFSAVPPQVDASQGSAPTIDWAPLFTEAGLDLAKFTSTAPQWSPQSYADARAAWEGEYADHPDVAIRIEGAAYRGRPVYFRVLAPWDRPMRQATAQSSWREQAAIIILMTVLLTVVGAGVVLARSNLRLGRGDREGAFKLALFSFSVMLLGLLIGADHVPLLEGELSILYQAISYSLFTAVMLWILYVALEPYVRRHWPQLPISWSRLLAGDFRDPMVGRDVLVGGLLGLGHTAAIYAGVLLLQKLDASNGAAIPAKPATLGDFGKLIEELLTSLGVSVFAGLVSLLLLLLLYLLLRRQWMAAAVMWLIASTVEILFFGGSWTTTPSNMVIAALLVIAVFRFGLLTAMVWQFVFVLSCFYPLTTDLSVWYAHRSIFALAMLVALASYGTYVSLGGQRVFQGRLLEE
ncbi:MAG TPA: serine/threonine-protein kinase [Blastocatellia bacterium]|nr:serine/threonine-protein kinase [Blastocatellia bacterium]